MENQTAPANRLQTAAANATAVVTLVYATAGLAFVGKLAYDMSKDALDNRKSRKNK